MLGIKLGINHKISKKIMSYQSSFPNGVVDNLFRHKTIYFIGFSGTLLYSAVIPKNKYILAYT